MRYVFRRTEWCLLVFLVIFLSPSVCRATENSYEISDLEISDLEISDLEIFDLGISDLGISDLEISGLEITDIEISTLDISKLEITDQDIFDLNISYSDAEESAYDTIVDEFDFSGLDEFLGDNFTEEDFSFAGLLSELISGGGTKVLGDYAKKALRSALSDMDTQRMTAMKILFLGITAALFAILADIFGGSQVADTGFFLTYLMLVTVLLGAFSVISQIGENVLEAILSFLKVLLPTYFLAVGLSGGQTQAVAFYELTIGVIAFVEWIFQNFLLPAVNLYLMIALVNALAEEDALSRFAGLLRTVIEWTSRILFAAATGLNAIQGLVLSSADSQAVSVVQKLVGMIPGIGAGAETVTEIFMGAGRVIKNGIGGVALILLVAIALVPVLKLCLCYFLYLVMAAFLQPIAEPRFTGCLQSVAEGCGLVIRVLVSAILLFMVTIAIICMSTG
ncbi:MAG: stage III sporulation protein AE [Lachnospiraceae bacterium]|nr:stage III sporulation protein AE [Lachnospiraceae bacterium]